MKGGRPFTQVHVADADDRLLEAALNRLQQAKAPVFGEIGPAVETVDRALAKLNRYALHFAFLDPFNLGALPFEIIRKLAAITHMDILVHVSVQDLQRNLLEYAEQADSPLGAFAPGWREHVKLTGPQYAIRAGVLQHWQRLIAGCGMTTARTFEKIRGPNRQPLYWLAFAVRHPLAVEYWEKIVKASPEGQLKLI